MTAALHTTTTDAPAHVYQTTAYRTRSTAGRRVEEGGAGWLVAGCLPGDLLLLEHGVHVLVVKAHEKQG